MKINRGSEWRQWDLHVHTASSYDYDYKADDADSLLVQSWKENDISAVAITDHFKIDSKRLENLKNLVGDEIVIFPGVELRCDKGTSNLHVIIIFPETTDYVDLEHSFQSIMINTKAKAAEKNETIYWDFNDIVEFSKDHDGLLSIHTGSKDKGLDDRITNATPVNMAIKKEIAEKVDFFELGRKKDVDDYLETVIPHTGPKPLLLCSDNHDPREYYRKEKLWIKANRTFDGLKQVINHPSERVYIGDLPNKIDISNKRKSVYIDKVEVRRKEKPHNNDSKWFNYNIPLSLGLSVVIGNKGSGKSAFADILGHLCDCNYMREASFLNEKRFRKVPENYSEDYYGSIKWLDGKETENIYLSKRESKSSTQSAQYLPQKFIERVCTDLDKEFQQEINKVIFSYVDSTEKGYSSSLDDLIKEKTKPFNNKISVLQNDIAELNSDIISLEDKLTKTYCKKIKDNLEKKKDLLQRHLDNKPAEVTKPDSTLNTEDKKKLEKYINEIQEIEKKIKRKKDELTVINININKLKNAQSELVSFEEYVEKINNGLNEIKELFNDDTDFGISYSAPENKISEKISELKKSKKKLQDILDNSKNSNENSLYRQLSNLKNNKKEVIGKADAKEKAYQKYLEDLNDWEKIKKQIIGNANTDDCIEFYKNELDNIENIFPDRYKKLKESRKEKVKEIFTQKIKISKVYSSLYRPIEDQIKKLLENMDDKVEFSVNLVMHDGDIVTKILDYVNHSYSGIFSGKKESYIKLNDFINNTVFSDFESLINLLEKINEVTYEDIDRSSEKISNKQKFYDLIYNIDFIGVEFNLNYAKRDMLELSPGERGIVLLIFYLALNKGKEPLIIDQPEDNLDNESVFYKLVPCIKEAKKRRQVIIVTHNPNIAVACDAEQIIHCEIDKSKNEITYTAGSIEEEYTRRKIIDILEGTEPAFDLRRKKYLFTT